MLRNVFLKTLRDQRRGLLGWGFGLVAFAAYAVAFYPSIRDSAAKFADLFEQMPRALRALIGGELVDLTTPEGYLNTEFFSLMVPMLLLVFAIGFGARAVAGEERAGTLDLLLATPIQRWRIVIEKLAGLAVSIVALAVILWLALAGGTTAADMRVPLARLGAAVASAALLAFSMGALALAVGASWGRRGTAIAAASTLAIAGYLVNALAQLVQGLRPYRALSPFHHYLASDPLRHGLEPGHVIVLAGLTVAFGALAVLGFARRDLGT